MEAGAVPLFVTVKFSAALVCPRATEPKAWDIGETVIGAVPVPCNVIVCVPTVSVIVIAPVSTPIAVGLKVIEMVQFLPAATEVPQVFVSAKLALAAMLSIARAAVPPFVSLTELVPLVALTATEPKVCEVAESVTLWACALGTDIAKSNSAIPKNPIPERNFENIKTSLAGWSDGNLTVGGGTHHLAKSLLDYLIRG